MIKKILITIIASITLVSCGMSEIKDEIVKNGDNVAFHFISKIEHEGELFDYFNSYNQIGEPIELVVGEDEFYEGFYDNILGMKAGDKKDFVLNAPYGERTPEFHITIPRENFEIYEEYGIELIEGNVIPTEVGDHEIIEINEEEITLINFMLGKDIHISVEIVEINSETKEIKQKETDDIEVNNQINNDIDYELIQQIQNREKDTSFQLEGVKEDDIVVLLETNKGEIKIKMFKDEVPKTANNFIQHSLNGYYDDIIFHRVIDGFMIQGGDPKGNGTGGESVYGKSFEDEFHIDLYNIRGSISMANSGPNTNGSQFFINQVDNLFLDGRHSVFGQVIEGMDIVDKIASVETSGMDKPLEDIVITSTKVLKYTNGEYINYEINNN